MTVRIGAKLPHTGDTAPAAPLRAHALEQVGFDALWVSDHVILPRAIASRYPFAADGVATWPTTVPYLEALITLAAAAAVTSRVTLGTAALVLPQRNPVLLAKQVASIDALSGGRVALGVGAGWLREEFDALEAPFAGRGGRTDEWISILRDCWTGSPPGRDGAGYRLPDDMVTLPAPRRPIPLYVGGHSRAALRRAGRLGDGWLAQQSVPSLDVDRLTDEITVVRAEATAASRDPARVHVVLRLVDSAGRAHLVAKHLSELTRAGVDEIIVDVAPDGDPAADHDLLRDAASTR